MRKYIFITPLIIFFCIILVFFYLLIIKRDPSDIPSVLLNQKVPIFETTSLFNDEPLISKQIFGKETIIVNFFATWCAPCLLEHPYIIKLSKEKDIKVIGVNYKDDSKKTIQWLNKLGNPYSEVIVDSKGHIGLDWGVYGIPETFIVNKNNIIVYKQLGPITKEICDDFYQQIKKSF